MNQTLQEIVEFLKNPTVWYLWQCRNGQSQWSETNNPSDNHKPCNFSRCSCNNKGIATLQSATTNRDRASQWFKRS